jgi:hypothetical protein
MDAAAKILIIGGVLNLVYGFATGFLFATVRSRNEFAPRYLVMAHTGPFMQGPMLLALVFATNLSPLPPGLEAIAAFFLVANSFLIAAKDTINWMQGVNDEFAERPWLPRALGVLGVFLGIPGLLILVYGVFRGL